MPRTGGAFREPWFLTRIADIMRGLTTLFTDGVCVICGLELANTGCGQGPAQQFFARGFHARVFACGSNPKSLMKRGRTWMETREVIRLS